MKKLPLIFLFIGLVVGFISCSEEDENWNEYKEWRNTNNAWLTEQGKRLNPDGTRFYDTIRPDYDKGQYVLAHWFNDRKLTQGNLKPYYTSTVDVKYIGRLYNDEPFDSSYTLMADYGDSIFRTKVGRVIAGWTILLQEMHVGDSVEVLIPYQSAYGASGSGSIPPYSNLKFGVKLVNVPFWEIEE